MKLQTKPSAGPAARSDADGLDKEGTPHSQRKSLYVNWTDIYRFSPDVADDVLNHLRDFNEGPRLYDLLVDVDLSDAKVRIYELFEADVMDVSDVSRYENTDRLMDVRG